MGCYVRCLLLGPLWAAVAIFAAEDELKEKARVFWISMESSQRESQRRQYDELIRSVAKHLKLDEKRQSKLIEAAKPLYDAGLEHWRKIYEIHIIANGNYETNPDFYGTLGDSVHHPKIQESRKNLRELWAKWLQSNLSADEHSAWQEEATKRRERAIKSMPKGVDHRIDTATKAVKLELEGEVAQKVSDAELDEARAKQLTGTLAKVEEIYRREVRKQIEGVLEDWKAGDFLTDLGKVVALEKQGTMTIYVPGTKQAYQNARKVLDDTWKTLVTAEEEKKVADKRAAMSVRLEAAAKTMSERMEEQVAQPQLKKQEARLDGLIQTIQLDQNVGANLKAKLADTHKGALDEWRKSSQAYMRKSIEAQVGKGNREERLKQN